MDPMIHSLFVHQYNEYCNRYHRGSIRNKKHSTKALGFGGIGKICGSETYTCCCLCSGVLALNLVMGGRQRHAGDFELAEACSAALTRISVRTQTG